MRKPTRENSIHTFVVLAYKESPYLERAIQSCLLQEYPSKVVIGTSTDNEYIRSYAEKYHLDVIVNPVKGGGSVGDFDFAWSHGGNTIVTIAHQDDIYDPSYSRRIVEAYLKNPQSAILFTDYYEIRNGEKVYSNRLLNVKRLMLTPLKMLGSSKSVFWKQSPIRFGNGICCPSVAYVPSNIPYDTIFKQNPDEPFCEDDWHGWYNLSLINNTAFTYIPEPIMGHRIEENTHTSQEIEDGSRSLQELNMLKKFWPDPVAETISKYLREGQKSNQL